MAIDGGCIAAVRHCITKVLSTQYSNLRSNNAKTQIKMLIECLIAVIGNDGEKKTEDK